MRILQACPYAWDLPGGAQLHVHQLSAELRRRGHDVLVLAPAAGDHPPEGARIVGRALRVPYQGTVAPICFSPRSLVKVGRALREFRPDVVHAHEPIAPSTGMFAALRSKAPVVATLHAFAERSALFDVAAPLLRLVWRRLAVRIAVSEAGASFYRRRLPGEIRIVPNGLDVRPFVEGEPDPALPPNPRVVWVGRLDPQKGFRIALDAFAELVPEFPDLSFIVAGDGNDRSAVGELPPAVRERVVMLGAVTHERLPTVLAGADVAVFPAVGQESFGIVLLEAMAAGVPVVASRIPGYDEVVRHAVDGLLVRPNDAHALAGAVEQVLGEPDLAGGLREAGRERVEEFAWDRVAGELEAIYREVLSG